MGLRSVTRPVVRPLVAALFEARGGGFSPRSLFLAADQGAWYDPADLSSMFQDGAGTTPVTAYAQPVGKINDKSGRGNHATQATAGNRPTVDATTGLVMGAAKTIATPAFLNSTFNNACTIFAVVTAGVPHTDLRLIMGRSSPNFWVGINGTTLNADFTSGLAGDGGFLLGDSTGILAMSIGSGRFRAGMARWWFQNANEPVSASASVSQRTSGVSGNLGFAGEALTLGGQSSSSFLWPGSIGEFIAINREVTLAEYKQTIQYLTAKWGMYNKKLVVCMGNSLTSGQGSTGGATQNLSASGTNYPARVLNALSATYDVRTDAYPGRNLQQLIAETPEFGDLMTVHPSKRKVAVVWEITNELAANQSPSATLALLQTLCAQKRAAGFSVLVGTCLNRGDASTYAGFDTDRQTVNASVLANFSSYADGVIDFAAVSELTNPSNATYFNADKIHLTDAGYQKVADAVVAKLAALGW